ncbi:MAG TPA: peroxiredoxin [Candidatus Dormibacteraeota bacterium]
MLEPGAQAPDFEARRPDGSSVRLSELRSRFVLVYFYPKDGTPGCTAEACSLNDRLGDLGQSGAEVMGVSSDSWQSHQGFQERHGLGFALAADSDHRIAAAYGVGRMLGILPVSRRSSFLVGPDGGIVETWPSVNPSKHAEQVLEAVRRHGRTVPSS